MSINNDLKYFLEVANPSINNLKYIKIPRLTIEQINNLAISSLNVRDIGKLRDKHEGQLYLSILKLKIISLNIISLYYKMDILDWDRLHNKEFDNTLIFIDNKKYRIIPFFYGELPVIKENMIEHLVFCVINNDFSKKALYGILNNYDFKNKNIFKKTFSNDWLFIGLN